MKTVAKPIRTTLIFGLICGLLMALFFSGMRRTFLYYPMFQGLIWTCLAAYGVLLARWSATPLSRVIFPLALPLILLAFNAPSDVFLLCCLFMLSWVRSGVCFPGKLLGSLGAELAICFGGAALIGFFEPRSALSWGLGVWLFFLVQSLYFMFQAGGDKTVEDEESADPFEAARRNAEEILGVGNLNS